jgi:hypothetical protein
MKAINQRAKKVMDLLIDGVIMDAAESKKIDNTEGTFMPVHVEAVMECSLGKVYSVAHYYEQEGDLMRDPDMEFILGGDGEFYPISFWQDSPLIRDEPLTWGSYGELVSYNVDRQAALVTFANTWMKNIKEQQGLVV